MYNAHEYNTNLYNGLEGPIQLALFETQASSDAMSTIWNTSLSLTEVEFLSTTLGKQIPNKSIQDEIRLDTWTNLELGPATQWTNSDNNNQFPPES